MTTNTSALGGGPVQTPENTTAPFDPLPQTAQVTMVPVEPVASTASEPVAAPEPVMVVTPPRPKPTGYTKEMRAAKAAAKAAQEVTQIVSDFGVKTVNPRPAVAAVDDEGVRVLRALVQKLVDMENNIYYRQVWMAFFSAGGVYDGPRYLDELQAAVNYLIKIEAK